MNRLFRTASLVVACLALAANTVSAASVPRSGFKVFTSKQGHYRLSYPASWHTQKIPLGAVNSRFIAPNKASVSILVMPGAAFASADDFAALVEKSNLGWKISGKTRTRVAGSLTWMITGQLSNGPRNRSTAVAFLGRGQAWQIIYTAHPSKYSQTWSDFQKLLSSFTFTA